MSHKKSSKSIKKRKTISVSESGGESENNIKGAISTAINFGFRKGTITKEDIESDSSNELITSNEKKSDKHYGTGLSPVKIEKKGFDESNVGAVKKKSSPRKSNSPRKPFENSSFFNEGEMRSSSEEDEQMIERVEAKINEQKSKVNILQNVTLVKALTPKEELAELYPSLVPVKAQIDIDLSDADLYMLMIPRNIDPNILLGQDSIHQKCKIKMGKKFILQPTNKQPDPCLLIPNGKEILQFKDYIIMSQYLKARKLPELEMEETVPIKLPDNLKSRHPLLGSNFEENLQLGQDVQQKLDAAMHINLMDSQKQTKKRKEKETDNKEVIYDLLNFKKLCRSDIKSSKSNNGISDDSAFSSASSNLVYDHGRDQSSSFINPKSSKKKKDKNKVSDAIDGLLKETGVDEYTIKRSTERNATDSQQDLQLQSSKRIRNSDIAVEDANNGPLRKKKKKNMDEYKDIKEKLFADLKNESSLINYANQSNMLTDTDGSGRKKKREAFSEFETDFENEHSKKKDYLKEYETDYESNKQKKKKLINLSECLKREPLTEYETEFEATEKETLMNENNLDANKCKKKKRKSLDLVRRNTLTELKTDFEDNEYTKKKQCLTDYETDYDTNKLKKKKKKIKHLEDSNTHRSDSRIKESLTEYETDYETIKQKTKKKKSLDSRKTEFDAIRSLACSETCTQSRQHKKISLKTEPLTEYETDAEFSLTKSNEENAIDIKSKARKKKKKWLKKEPQTEYETDSELGMDKSKERNVENEPKKEKNNSLSTQNIKSEYLLHLEGERKTEKRKSSIIENLKKELVTEYETDYEANEQKKKKKRKSGTESVKDIIKIKKEIVTEYETDAENLIQQKKKKKRISAGFNIEGENDSFVNSTFAMGKWHSHSFDPDISEL